MNETGEIDASGPSKCPDCHHWHDSDGRCTAAVSLGALGITLPCDCKRRLKES